MATFILMTSNQSKKAIKRLILKRSLKKIIKRLKRYKITYFEGCSESTKIVHAIVD